MAKAGARQHQRGDARIGDWIAMPDETKRPVRPARSSSGASRQACRSTAAAVCRLIRTAAPTRAGAGRGRGDRGSTSLNFSQRPPAIPVYGKRRAATSVFSMRGHASAPVSVTRCTSFVLAAHDAGRRADTSLATIQSQPLRARLAVACSTTSLGLGGEADHEARPARRRPRRASPGCPGSAPASSAGAPPPSFLIFCPAPPPPASRRRRRRRRRYRPAARPRTRPASRARVSTRRSVDARRVGHRDRAAHQRDPRAEPGQRGGDGVALLAGAAVGDVAHRVDRLMRGAAGHQRVPAGERRAAGRPAALDRVEDRGRLGQAARARIRCRPSRPRPARPQQRRAVAASPCCRPSPGAATCARSSPAPPAPACRSPAARAGQVVGEPGRHLRQHVGARRRDHDEVGGAAELDVAHLALVGERPQLGIDLSSVSACRLKRRHELRAASVSTHGDAHARPCAAAGPVRATCRRRCRR